VHAVERLVALHVVLPARSAFFSRGGSGIDYSQDEPDWSAVKPVTDTFRPLLEEATDQEICPMGNTEEQKVATIAHTTGTKNPSWRPAELLPTFLDIIIRSVPRDTFHRQATEASWLETSFVAIAELAFSTIKQASPSHDTSKFVPVLEEMFGVVRNRKVQLSLNTFLTHAAYTGLLKDGLDKVQWSLVALLVELGVDIFLPNSGFKDSQRLLTALLGKIMLQWTSSSGHKDSNGTYPLIKTGVVIPLLRGFAAARALPEFSEIWREQLVNVETARARNDTLANFSVWEDDDLCRTYGELMSSSLTDAQIASHVQRAIVEMKSETGSISTSATSYAYFVILEAGSETWMHYGGLTELITSLMQVLEASKTILSSRKGMHWRWRIWRLAGNLLETIMKQPNGSLNEFGTGLVDQAVKLVLRLHQERKVGLKDYPEILEACRFVLKVTNGFDSSSSEKLNLLTENIATFLRSLVPADCVSLEGSWNGRVEDLDSPISLATAFVVSILRTPEIWAKVKAENRQAIFSQLLALATVPQHETGSSPSTRHSLNVNFLQLWTALVSHDYLLHVPQICRDLLSVLSDRLDKSVSERSFIVSSLQRFPTRLVSRHQRGVILDMLKEILLNRECSLALSADILSLVAKWAQMPKSAAAITSDWEGLWRISKAVQLDGSEIDLRVMQSFRCLAKAVISKLLLLSDEERQKVFKKMYRKMSSSFSKLERLDDKALEPFLFNVLLSQLWEHRTEISDAVDGKDLKAQRKKLFKLVLASLHSGKDLLKQKTPEEKDVIALTKSLDALEGLEDIAQGSEEANACLEEIERNIMDASTGSGRHLQKLTRRRVLTGTRPGEKIELPTSNLAKVFPMQRLYGEEQQLFVREATERFRSMSSDELVEAIQGLREAGFHGANATYRLLLAGLAVASLSPVEEKESVSAKELSALCGDLTKALQRSTSIDQFSLTTECLDMLLRSHPRAITQWNVDDILATVATSISAVGPQIPSEYAQTIYVRLCRLTGLLFSLYRQKIGGRFHLVVPVMQHLLSCFFLPNRKRKRASQSTVQRPPWLARLDASHAVHFTRLLTSLCDPTVSAVSRPTQAGPGHEALTDQTKKAKRIAGQNLQHLVSAYAQWSLHSPLDAETKAALLPGLYAVLDVMSRETKRSLNASLDASGRAIFKTLHDDYVKFGKWNNKA
jgi:nucleolar pre-ribosomal-associated protein 2